MSQREKLRRSEYEKVKRSWRKRHPFCTFPGCDRRAENSPHHMRGRLGSLLCDTRYWCALCFEHHTWVHNNINTARELNLIAKPGDWGRAGPKEDK